MSLDPLHAAAGYATGGRHTANGASGRPRVVATYRYTDEFGALLFEKLHYELGFNGDKKSFLLWHKDEGGAWVKDLEGVRRALYCLHELARARPDLPVLVAEGEKAADALAGLGFLATCSLLGASQSNGKGKWLPEYSKFFRGRHVLILPDNEDAGRRHAQDVAGTCTASPPGSRSSSWPACPRRATPTTGFSRAVTRNSCSSRRWRPRSGTTRASRQDPKGESA